MSLFWKTLVLVGGLALFGLAILFAVFCWGGAQCAKAMDDARD